MKLTKYILFFLIINFGALGLGIFLMENGPRTTWYINLNKAPWTPPGWFFGVAWSVIMICFSFYMAYLHNLSSTIKVKTLFLIQFILNVSWNYVFFNQHLVCIGLVIIALLTIIIGMFLFDYKNVLKTKTALIIPYFIWICIATSLNAYVVLNN